jgi:4-diphosphocytidyl-2-C-methyl-D-erythritol kinase
MALALGLGADVPFFLSGGHAWVEGVGEKISPITLPSGQFLVVKPPLGLSTHSIFSASGLKRDSETATLLGFAAYDKTSALAFGRNDLQPVAIGLCPQIAQSLDWLSAKQLQGRMTGSGSAVFAHLPHEVDISGHPDGFEVRKCSNLQVHPLKGW